MELRDQSGNAGGESAGPLALWVDFFAALLGAGAMLLLLHLLGVPTLLAQLAALL